MTTHADRRLTVCEQTEEIEARILSPAAARSRESRGRAQPEEPCPIRTCFQRDRDRIIHSKAFRRLTYKTQVFIAPEEDHYRTRLTHTLEVAQIARGISRGLRLNEDLTEAIALGHDLGHTPFGHAGEWALDEAYRRFDPEAGFHHQEQSLRVVEVLENNGRGLNLTEEVRDGIHHHSKGREDLALDEEPRAATLEGQVVRYADRIAYVNHDLDDAIRGRVITEADVPEECARVLGRTHSQRIHTMVVDAIEESSRRGVIAMSANVLEATNRLKDFLFARVYGSAATGEAELDKVREVVANLFAFYMAHPAEVPGGERAAADPKQLARAVCDHIAGMTDRYARSQFVTHFLPRGWRADIP